MKLFLLACLCRVVTRIATWAGSAYEAEEQRRFDLPPNYHINLVARTMVEGNSPLARAIIREAAFRGTSKMNLQEVDCAKQ